MSIIKKDRQNSRLSKVKLKKANRFPLCLLFHKTLRDETGWIFKAFDFGRGRRNSL